MSHNFAPYQDDDPASERALSPPPIQSPGKRSPNNRALSPNLPNPGAFEDDPERDAEAPRGNAGFGNGMGADERNVDVYSTSLPMRLDFLACLAYVLLPPAGPAMLLVFEHKSDYVRFHAWQSALVFGPLFIIHLIFSFSKVISYLLLVIDLVLIAFLTMHAYQDTLTLERFELPFFGRYANSFVDEE